MPFSDKVEKTINHYIAHLSEEDREEFYVWKAEVLRELPSKDSVLALMHNSLASLYRRYSEAELYVSFETGKTLMEIAIYGSSPPPSTGKNGAAFTFASGDDCRSVYTSSRISEIAQWPPKKTLCNVKLKTFFRANMAEVTSCSVRKKKKKKKESKDVVDRVRKYKGRPIIVKGRKA